MAAPPAAESEMSGTEFRHRLRELGRTHAGFAREIGSSSRSVDRWINDRPPPEIAYIVDLLATLELHVAPNGSLAGTGGMDSTIEVELDVMLRRAVAQKRGQDFVEAVRRWLAGRASSVQTTTETMPTPEPDSETG